MAKLPKTDPDRALKGVWVDFEGGIRFRIARIGNQQYLAKIRELLVEDMPTIKHRRGTVADRELDAHLRASAEFVLVDWEGIEDDDGNALPYSVEAAYSILSSPETQEVAEFIIGVAKDSSVYRRISVEKAQGN